MEVSFVDVLEQIRRTENEPVAAKPGRSTGLMREQHRAISPMMILHFPLTFCLRK